MIAKSFLSAKLIAFLTLVVLQVPAQTKKAVNFKAGHIFKDCPSCPEMVVIPAGNTVIGSKENEIGHADYFKDVLQLETPRHTVNIQQFACGKFDITKAEWATFVNETNHPPAAACSWANLPGDTTNPWEPSKLANWNHIGFAQDSSHPVVCITWNDAQDYIQWLNKKTGKGYRLLTEAEWEYAARANTTTAYWWGDKADHAYANYGTDTTNGVGFASGRDKWIYSSPVGSFPPNPFGLYDMNGNVLQWVEDCLADSYSNTPSDGTAYISRDTLTMRQTMWSWLNGKQACSYRICRGGDYGDSPELIRSASRNFGEVTGDRLTNYASSGCGFRVARNLK